MNSKNSFTGPTSILDFLDPEKSSYTPLVELPTELNPFMADGVRIMVKMTSLLPLGNIKSIPAYRMLREASREGKLDGVSEIVEASSGNTALSLTVIAKALGIHRTTSFVSHEISSGKLKLLRMFGSTPVVFKEPICADPNDPDSRLYKARIHGQAKGVYNADQYSNPHNPTAHEKVTGKQIWEQTEGKISVLVSSLGTTGTVVGAGRYLKRMNSKTQVLATVRKPNNLVPGLRTMSLLREIEHDWEGVVDHVELVGSVESYSNSLHMIQNGLLVGPSTGFALAGLKKWLQKIKDSNMLDQYKNKDGEILCVFVACDTPYPYVDDYFRYLPPHHFPKVVNRELLSEPIQESHFRMDDTAEIDPISAFENLYPYTAEELVKLADDGIDIQLHPKKYILDISPEEMYREAHLYGSENVPYAEIITDLNSYAAEYRGFDLYIVCPLGQRSASLALEFRELGINAVSITGGLMDWSNSYLPRYSIAYCVK